MKTLGLLGGTSWESTLVYYRFLNTLTRDRTTPLTSSALILHSFNFEPLAAMQKAGDWDEINRLFGDAACGLKNAGAEALLLCANTMHLVADTVEARSGLKVLHIVDATARKIVERGLSKGKIGLLATAYTMEPEGFYVKRMKEKFGLEVVPPREDNGDRAEVHRVIYEELCVGIIRDESRKVYKDIVRRMIEEQGIGCVILGCTEIMLLIREEDDMRVPALDTARLHAEYAVDWALDDGGEKLNGAL